MGVLRSDRVSGLGGANAINGSAFFSGGTGIETAPSSAWDFTTSNFTIEFWTYFTGFDSSGFTTFIKTGDTTAANSIWQIDLKTSTNNLRFIPYVSDSSVVYESSWTPSTNTWYHVAATKSGTSIRMFVDGTQIGSTHTFSQTWDSETVGLSIGKRAIGSFERDFNGYLSNMRIIKGTALYTANFTPPTARLEKTSDTVFLAFQSPGDVLKEETGKILYPSTDGEASAPAVASRFVPDKGEDHGTTFADGAVFDTLSYMVPPGGTTAQSNRGRALFGGGYLTPGFDGGISYLEMQSSGNTIDFGDLSVSRGAPASNASSTRGIWGGGSTPAGVSDVIDYVTINTTGNATDFGNLTVARKYFGACGSQTRGLFGGGDSSPGAANNDVIDYITIATTADAQDFGNLSVSRQHVGACSSPTRGVWAGGRTPTKLNTIDYITIATTGDAADFGDLTVTTISIDGLSSNTRGLFAGGTTPTMVNTIGYITIATTGNAADFGDLITVNSHYACTSNGIKGIWSGGYSGSGGGYNLIEYVNIASTGNAKDWGDTYRDRKYHAGCSDSHGGLSE